MSKGDAAHAPTKTKGDEPPRVFISYSHDSLEHELLILRFAKRLRDDGVDAQIDQYVGGRPPGGWPKWMWDKLDWAEFVLLICTETYNRRFRGHEEPEIGKGVDFEGQLITLDIYNSKSRTTKFLPVVFSSLDREFVPQILSDHPYILDSEDGYQELYSVLTGQAGELLPPVRHAKEQKRNEVKPLTFRTKSIAFTLADKSPTDFASSLFKSKLGAGPKPPYKTSEETAGEPSFPEKQWKKPKSDDDAKRSDAEVAPLFIGPADAIKIALATELKKAMIRVSISGLFRIVVDDEFMLIKGHRIDHQYQPVGGVLKRWPSAARILEPLGLQNDDKIRIDADSAGDLRVRLPGRSLKEFFEWYRSGRGRETYPWREFYEELLAPRILPLNAFPYLDTEHLRTYVSGIKWSEYLQDWEVLVSEIYAVYLNQKQEDVLRDLRSNNRPEIRWAKEREIRTRGVIPLIKLTADIAANAMWLL